MGRRATLGLSSRVRTGPHAGSAYRDEPIPISHLQVTTQPSLAAKMVEALELQGNEKVLEVATGYGYQTALLARLAREVWSIELWPDMTDAAKASLTKCGIADAHGARRRRGCSAV